MSIVTDRSQLLHFSGCNPHIHSRLVLTSTSGKSPSTNLTHIYLLYSSHPPQSLHVTSIIQTHLFFSQKAFVHRLPPTPDLQSVLVLYCIKDRIPLPSKIQLNFQILILPLLQLQQQQQQQTTTTTTTITTTTTTAVATAVFPTITAANTSYVQLIPPPEL